ncbi:MAG: type II secretion system F family protein [Actinomyces graevenitzii]|nr:type II secretion system F family protein [Actinomyces graevenitzii]
MMRQVTALGFVICALGSSGVWLIYRALFPAPPTLASRVEPYVHLRKRSVSAENSRSFTSFIGALVAQLGRAAENTGSSSGSVRRRLNRINSPLSVEDFRLQQLACAVAALVATIAFGVGASRFTHVAPLGVVVLALIAAVVGLSARDWYLSVKVRRYQKQLVDQLPDTVELLALAVGAGLSPQNAIERVCMQSSGPMHDQLQATLSQMRAGSRLAVALEDLSERNQLPALSRFCQAMIVAIERGTPMAEVLRAQAYDAREAARRALMEEGGRKEIAQMVPVVFLVLPVTVVFALYPGLAVLHFKL